MKKIITLLFSVGAFATSFAQYNHQQNNDDRNYRADQYANSSNGDWHDRNWHHSNRGGIYSAKMRDFQIEKINREFNMRVEAIKCDRYLGRHAKRAAIRDAGIERSRQIQMVNERFNNHWNR